MSKTTPTPRPDFATRFKTERQEALTAQFAVRIPPSLLEKIKQQDNWQEKARQLLAEGFGYEVS